MTGDFNKHHLAIKTMNKYKLAPVLPKGTGTHIADNHLDQVWTNLTIGTSMTVKFAPNATDHEAILTGLHLPLKVTRTKPGKVVFLRPR